MQQRERPHTWGRGGAGGRISPSSSRISPDSPLLLRNIGRAPKPMSIGDVRLACGAGGGLGSGACPREACPFAWMLYVNGGGGGGGRCSPDADRGTVPKPAPHACCSQVENYKVKYLKGQVSTTSNIKHQQRAQG